MSIWMIGKNSVELQKNSFKKNLKPNNKYVKYYDTK